MRPDVLDIVPKERYEVVRLLAKGFSGAVYVAWDLATQALVVLKLLYLRDRESRARAEREITVLQALPPSAHVVIPVSRYFAADSTAAVLVSEYVSGPSLQTLVEIYQPGLPREVIVAMASQVCRGVKHLHENGIIHRDIKPSNILTTTEGLIKLCDFGIAVASSSVDTATTITTDGMFVGTMRYAAPEMVSSDSFSPASDVYAIGVTILFMVLGRQPYEAATFGYLIQAILKGALFEELPNEQRSFWGDILRQTLHVRSDVRPTAEKLLEMLHAKKPLTAPEEIAIVSQFVRSSGSYMEVPSDPAFAISTVSQGGSDNPLANLVQSLASQIVEVQAALIDATAKFSSAQLTRNGSDALSTSSAVPERQIDAAFKMIRRRLALYWQVSLIMTIVLFSLFVAMLVLAVVTGVVARKSQLGLVFGGTSMLSLLTVVLWKPMDKMLFSTIATQQLELIQLNYQRALDGDRRERREVFRDVSTQLSTLLTKVSAKRS